MFISGETQAQTVISDNGRDASFVNDEALTQLASTAPTEQLFSAIERNNLSDVREAIEAGADLTAKNAEGLSPGDLAVELQRFDIVRYLLSVSEQTGEAVNQNTPDPDLVVGDVTEATANSGASLFRNNAIFRTEKQETPIIPENIEPLKAPTGQPIMGNVLQISDSVSLGQPLLLGADQIGYKYRCIDRDDAITVFCVQPLEWPRDIAPFLPVTTVMFGGEKYIARYDGAISTRIHALFPTDAFELVAAYYQRQFGAPTEAFAPVIAPFSQPRQTNPTVIWRTEPSVGQPGLVLEIRKFDNVRSAFPDLARGAVMLYTDEDHTIFTRLSPLDFMLSKKEVLGEARQR